MEAEKEKECKPTEHEYFPVSAASTDATAKVKLACRHCGKSITV